MSSISLEHKLAVHELLGRAALGYDIRDLSMIEQCFCEDATFSMRIADGELVGPFEGREAIMGLMTSSMDDQADVRRHVISNIIFVAGSNSTAEVLSNLTLLATEQGKTQLLAAGLYRDQVVLQASGWQLAQRHLDLDAAY